MWMEGEKQKVVPKTVGTSFMVSGFACPCHGFMKGVVDGEEKTYYQLFEAGKTERGGLQTTTLWRKFKLRFFH